MAPKKQIEANELMVVNDSPGEECRIAILQDNLLEELYTERVSSATNVGNIYKGRVVNVEPAIQAAFIDYGEGINGFLHISDLHPKYFPGEERTPGLPPPMLGQHTDEVLHEMGLSAASIAELRRDKIIG